MGTKRKTFAGSLLWLRFIFRFSPCMGAFLVAAVNEVRWVHGALGAKVLSLQHSLGFVPKRKCSIVQQSDQVSLENDAGSVAATFPFCCSKDFKQFAPDPFRSRKIAPLPFPPGKDAVTGFRPLIQISKRLFFGKQRSALGWVTFSNS